eukprot:7488801-Alexandrium_andersonii.AAC.1
MLPRGHRLAAFSRRGRHLGCRLGTYSGLSRSKSEGLRGLRIAGLGLRVGARKLAIPRPQTPSRPVLVGRFGICTENRAECTPRELRGPI